MKFDTRPTRRAVGLSRVSATPIYLTGEAPMPLHRRTVALRAAENEINWRSRLVILAVLLTAIGIYAAGLVWFGQGLAEDMRAGVREVQAGVLIPDRER